MLIGFLLVTGIVGVVVIHALTTKLRDGFTI
jgi:hypothetical protein